MKRDRLDRKRNEANHDVEVELAGTALYEYR